MEKEINIADLLKDCPKGMELYSTIFGTVYFEGVRDTGHAVLIDITTVCNTEYQFYPDGKFNTYYTASEMTLFPSKDVRTWEGIEAPFKDGDIVATDDGIFTAIVGKVAVCEVEDLYNHDEEYDTYCHIYYEEDDDKAYFIADDTPLRFDRLATEEEKERLFQAIKDNGYQWNAEAKTLEKLVELKFKVGDRIMSKKTGKIYNIDVIGKDCYFCDIQYAILFENQDNYELAPNKFDINTLKPFDKVLVRDNDKMEWDISFFSHCNGLEFYKYSCLNGSGYAQCIPYEENKHLLGKTDDCSSFYKTWE